MRSNNWIAKLLAAVVVLFLFVLPQVFFEKYYIHVLIMVLFYVVLATSLRLMFITGQLNMAHVAFLGIGAYTSALLVMRLHWSFWLALPAAGLVSAIVAVLLGYPTLRIKGVYFIIVTFAFSQIVTLVWIEWIGLFGGASGLVNIPVPNPIQFAGINLEFQAKSSMYYVVLVLALLTLLVMYRIDKSRLGKTLKAIKENDLLSECLGVNLLRYKVVAFAISSFFAGLAGSFYAHYFYSISPFHFSEHMAIDVVVFAVAGGIGSVFGPVVGSAVLVVLMEWLKSMGNWDFLAVGVILIAVMLFLPAGLIDLPRRLRRQAQPAVVLKPQLAGGVEKDLA